MNVCKIGSKTEEMIKFDGKICQRNRFNFKMKMFTRANKRITEICTGNDNMTDVIPLMEI